MSAEGFECGADDTPRTLPARGTSVFVYFKTPRSAERFIRERLARLTREQGSADGVLEAAFALRGDDGSDTSVHTWLEHYRLAPGVEIRGFLTDLGDTARDAGLSAPTLVSERHCEVFTWEGDAGTGVRGAGSDGPEASDTCA